MDHLIPDKDNLHPLLKLEGNERKSFTIKSIIITLVMTSTIYLLPNYYWLEMITTDSSYFLLSLFHNRYNLISVYNKLQDHY